MAANSVFCFTSQEENSRIVLRRKINSSYEANERHRVRQRASAFHDSLVSFLFVHFLLVKTFFPILCRFTHISFKALDFLYFLFHGNNKFDTAVLNQFLETGTSNRTLMGHKC